VPVHIRLPRVAVLGAAALLLLTLRAHFPAQPDPRRLRTAGQVSLGLLLLVAVGSGWGLVSYQEKPRQIGAALLADFTPARPAPIGHDNILALLVGVGGLALLALMFAPGPAPEPGTAAQRHLVAQLAGEPGSDSLAPFATRRDKSYVFSPDGRAAIGYRVFFGTALAGGDPVGDPASAGAAVAEFLRRCDREGWRPGVLGAGGPAWAGHDLRGLTFGDEAVLDVATFSLGSRRMRNVRQAVHRTHNAGVKVTIGPLTDRLAVELHPVLAAWLSGRIERGFAMNLDTLLLPRPDCLVAVARDERGEAVAFARFAVCAGGRVLTLDVAPRRRDAPNGVVERLVAEVVEHGRATGVEEVSLNFAGLRRVFESPSRLARLATVSIRVFDPWIELWPLYRFCAKFRPTWRPRRILARSWPALAPVAVAALTAEFGQRAPELPEVPEAQVCGGVS
jgi:lysyl-tRNA synthetase class 2